MTPAEQNELRMGIRGRGAADYGEMSGVGLMSAELRQTPADHDAHDAQWFICWAVGHEAKPGESDVEAFCERVAIKMAEGYGEQEARVDAAWEWLGRK